MPQMVMTCQPWITLSLEDMELDDNEEADIINDAALLVFSSVLQHAQEIAKAAENKKWGEWKRPKC